MIVQLLGCSTFSNSTALLSYLQSRTWEPFLFVLSGIRPLRARTFYCKFFRRPNTWGWFSWAFVLSLYSHKHKDQHQPMITVSRCSSTCTLAGKWTTLLEEYITIFFKLALHHVQPLFWSTHTHIWRYLDSFWTISQRVHDWCVASSCVVLTARLWCNSGLLWRHQCTNRWLLPFGEAYLHSGCWTRCVPWHSVWWLKKHLLPVW